MREYKSRPWISRQNNSAQQQSVAATTVVEFSIAMDIKNFDDHMTDMFRYALAGFLRIPPDQVRIIAKKEGSVRLLIELPEKSVKALIKGKSESSLLAGYFPLFDIQSIERAHTPVKTIATGGTAAATGKQLNRETSDEDVANVNTTVTNLLRDWSRGDALALEKLMPFVFEDLQAIAKRLIRNEIDRTDHELSEPTVLVSEVYLRLTDQRKVQWESVEQFFGVAALLMRRILFDSARSRQTTRRGGSISIVPLSEAAGIPELTDRNVVALDEALSRLTQIEPRQSRILELRFFAGMTHREIANALGISATTARRDWEAARKWLSRELSNRS